MLAQNFKEVLVVLYVCCSVRYCISFLGEVVVKNETLLKACLDSTAQLGEGKQCTFVDPLTRQDTVKKIETRMTASVLKQDPNT